MSLLSGGVGITGTTGTGVTATGENPKSNE
jgi:hypothetical protein